MKRYVIVQEDWSGDGQRGVEAVYAGPAGAGFVSREADLAVRALTAYLNEAGRTEQRVMPIQLQEVPDRVRLLMDLESVTGKAAPRTRLDKTVAAVRAAASGKPLTRQRHLTVVRRREPRTAGSED